jgi:ADP-dependent NAD(P)H-hydrate dehydratase / NAD(P)H-hydrate epimerase
MITGKEVKVLDKNAEFFGVPQEKLMEEAGKQLADFIETTIKDPSIVIICGLGNNGGDGFVAARYLSKNHSVSLFLVGEESKIHTSISRMNFSKLKQLPLKIYDIRSLSSIKDILSESTVIVDAMLGIGLSGTLRPPFDTIIEYINQTKNKTIIACDVPTGLGLEKQVQVHHTITFHDIKEGMNETNCGTIHIRPIGVPKKASTYIGPGELSEYYPKPKKESHKGQNGRVLIVGGGPFTGAPALSGLAALRTGADLVFLAVPNNIASIVASYSPNIIVKSLPSNHHLKVTDLDDLKDLLTMVDSVLIGPGLGTSSDTKKAIQEFITYLSDKTIPYVIDADGITALKDHHDVLKNATSIITPHAKEFYTFTGESLHETLEDQIPQVQSWAKKLNMGFFVKGPTDIISDGTITKLNLVHNEAMTVGGTGDVLAGIITGLLSKKTSVINAMRIAGFINGFAGNLAFERYSYGMCATDVIDHIPQVLKRYL